MVIVMVAITSIAAPAEENPEFAAKGLTRPVLSTGTAATVTFPGKPYRMEFRLPWQAGYVTQNNVLCAQGYAETFDKENCEGPCEICQDTESRYARMWIDRQNPARIVVRTRGALCDKNYKIAHSDIESGSPYGRGDWVDEWFYIYPDSTCCRVVTIYTGLARTAASSWERSGHPFECQETILIGRGRPPTSDINMDALTLITMSGHHKTIRFNKYPEKGELLRQANIQLVNLKARYSPFTMISDLDPTISAYYGPDIDHEHIDKRIFVGWPRGETWAEDYTVALTHVIDWKGQERTENTFTRVYLLGMTDAKTDEEKVNTLVPLASSWLKAPKLTLRGDGYHSKGYDVRQKAYVIRKIEGIEKASVDFQIAGTEESPVLNPGFVIEGWGESDARITVDGRIVETEGKLRIGHEKTKKGTDLVIWLVAELTKPINITVKSKLKTATDSQL